MIGRVATFASTEYLMSLNLQTAANLANVQTEQSSGLKSQTYSGISQDVSQLLNVNVQVAQLQTDDSNATTQLSAMQSTYSAMGDVTDLGTTMLSTMSSFLSGTASDPTTVQATAQSWLTQLASVLNTQYNGGYLFSGQASNIEPVNLSAPGYNPTASPTTPDTGYYQGSTSPTTYVGSDGYQTNTSVQADSPGFEEMFRALSLIVANPSSSSTLNQAYDLIQSGVGDVGAAQSVLAASTSSLTTYQEHAQAKVTTLSNLSISLKNTDLASAAVLIGNYQTQLDSSYSTISKLMGDSLAKYLG